jgi:guanylate kinase
MSSGQLFVISAPSGTGKNTLIQALLDTDLKGFGKLVHSVSHTTRSPRRGEVDGRDYHFVSRPEFEEMIAQDRFLEWAEVYGDYKGTASEEVDPRLEAGIDVILDIDVQGALQLFEHRSEATGIFILPPSREEMERRIRTRGLDGPEQISRRLSLSRWEIERYGAYDYAIINDDLGRASEALSGIILDKRHRRERMEDQIKGILGGFLPPGDNWLGD